MRAQMLLGLLAAWLIAAAPPDEKSKKAAEALQGDWVIESTRLGEKDVTPKEPEDRKAAIKGDRFTHKEPGGKDWQTTMKVDPSKAPATIDLYHEGKLAFRGIYAREGHKLSLCLVPTALSDLKGNLVEVPESARPTKFDSNQGWLIVMNRAK